MQDTTTRNSLEGKVIVTAIGETVTVVLCVDNLCNQVVASELVDEMDGPVTDLGNVHDEFCGDNFMVSTAHFHLGTDEEAHVNKVDFVGRQPSLNQH